MSKSKYCKLQLNDINNRLLSLEKKTSKILYTLEYLTNKIDDIHNDTFMLSSSSTINNISPICSPRIKNEHKYNLHNGMNSSISSPNNELQSLYIEDVYATNKNDTALPAISTAAPYVSSPTVYKSNRKNSLKRTE